MTIRSTSTGDWRAILLASSPLLVLASFANAQQVPAAASTRAAAAPTVNTVGAAVSTAITGSATEDSELSEVIVTGFRESLEQALQNKRNSVLPIESIAAEDIGKMPDQDVAESLQRLPGVQIDRGQQGEGTAVLIDGLRQNLTTLNGDTFLTGREFYVSGEASGGGAGSNAQYGSLQAIPSEELGGIDVYKNPQASMTEGGLGGTIDLKTRDPLASKPGFSFGGNIRGTDSTGTPGATPIGTLVGTYKFSERFAISGSFSYDEFKTQTNEFQDQNRNQWIITDYVTNPYTGPATSAAFTRGSQYYIDPQLAYFTSVQDTRKVFGGTLSAAWQVTDALKMRALWFGSHEKDQNLSYSDKVWFNGEGSANGTPASPGTPLPALDSAFPSSIDSNGVVQNGVFDANGAESATLYQGVTDSANNFQLNAVWDNGGKLTGSVDASFSKANSNLQAAQADVEHGLYEAFLGGATSPAAPGCNNGAATCGTDPLASHGYQFAWANGGTSGLPSVSYLAPYADILNNPAYATFKSNWAWANLTSHRIWSVKGDLHWQPDIGVFTILSGGFRYAQEDLDQTFGRYLINGATEGLDGKPAGQTAGNCCIGPQSGTYLYYQDPGYAAIPYSTAQTNPGLGMVVNIPNVGAVLVKNPNTGGMTNPSTYLESVWAGAGLPNNSEAFFVDHLSSFQVHEKTEAAYLQLDMGDKSAPFHVNFGLRVLNTTLEVDNGQQAAVPAYYGTASWNGVESNVVPVSHKRSYIDVLPSFNFSLNVTDQQKIRFGAARVTSPIDLYSLGLGNTYNFTRQTGGRTNTNPNSSFFGTADGFAFATGSSGNPNLDPYRATQFVLSWEDYFAPGSALTTGFFYKAVDSFLETETIPTLVNDDFGGTTGGVTQPVNAGAGRIYGVELGIQYEFGNLTPLANGFGIAANYTRSNSTSQQPTSFQTTGPIPGVAKDALTAQVYYENHGFTARMSYSYRDRILNDSLVGSTFAFKNQVGNEITYAVYGAPYGQLDAQISYDFGEHFGVLASAENLTDSALHTYLQWPNLPFTYDNSGRRYFAGFKFKF